MATNTSPKSIRRGVDRGASQTVGGTMSHNFAFKTLAEEEAEPHYRVAVDLRFMVDGHCSKHIHVTLAKERSDEAISIYHRLEKAILGEGP